MKNKRKYDYQMKRIKSLEKTVEELKSEKNVLEKELTSAKNLNEAYKTNSQELNEELTSMMERYKKGLDEIYDLKIKYEELIKETEKTRKEYKDKMGVLLQRLRKQTR